jgi:hypothetical protein
MTGQSLGGKKFLNEFACVCYVKLKPGEKAQVRKSFQMKGRKKRMIRLAHISTK